MRSCPYSALCKGRTGENLSSGWDRSKALFSKHRPAKSVLFYSRGGELQPLDWAVAEKRRDDVA